MQQCHFLKIIKYKQVVYFDARIIYYA